jgi:hypothetical protein
MSILAQACRLLLVGVLAVGSGAAHAGPGDAALSYALTMDGKSVGTRDVTITTMASDANTAAPRVLSSYTTLSVSIAGVPWTFQQRASALVSNGRSSFTSSVNENGTLREVQSRQLNDGSWTVVVVEKGSTGSGNLRASEVDLTSMDLFDPEARTRLTGNSRVKLLASETGTVLEGPVEDLGESLVRIAGKDVSVHRYAWTSAAGRMEFSWSMDGLLVGYQTSVLGKKVEALLTQAPAGISYGDVDDPRTGQPTVQEEVL